MRKILLLFIVSSFVILSCSKENKDHLLGTWKLDKAWRVTTSGPEYFQTDYDGYFIFSKGGIAEYVLWGDTTNGSWEAGRHTMNYYNPGSRAWENKQMQYLHIELIHLLDPPDKLEFHDFHFEDDGDKLKAEQHNLSDNRVYDFKRR